MKDSRAITPAEFQIIEVLWAHERPLSVGQVLKVLHRYRSVAYTTVMTLLDKMAKKGSVRRVKEGKAYFYRPAVRRSQVLDYLVRDFVDAYCDGETGNLSEVLSDLRPFSRRAQKASQRRMRPRQEPGPQAIDLDDMDIVLL